MFLSVCTRSVKIDMVCCEEGSAQCVVHNTMPGATTKRITLMVRPSYKVSQLFHDIRNQMQVENFDVSLQTHKEEEEVSVVRSTRSIFIVVLWLLFIIFVIAVVISYSYSCLTCSLIQFAFLTYVVTNKRKKRMIK